MTIEKWLADVYYDDCGGTQIWSKDEDGGSQLVAEVRGWGSLQNEFKTNEEAEKFQDEVGEFIVQAIREKIARTSSQTTSEKWKEYQDWLNEIPEISDEEIYNKAVFHDGSDYSLGEHNGFINGAKWYREQLKQRQ